MTPSAGNVHSEIVTFCPGTTFHYKRIPVSSFSFSRFSLISLVSAYEGQSLYVIFFVAGRIRIAVMVMQQQLNLDLNHIQITWITPRI